MTATQIQFRRGSAAQMATFTGAVGEVVVDTTNNRVVVQDGATAGGWPSEIAVRTAVNDANYSVKATDRIIAYTALSAARTVSLPAAASYPVGSLLFVVDESGAVTTSLTITASPNGSDTIGGRTSASIASAYGAIGLESNGSNAWTIVYSRGNGSDRTSVNNANYSVLATDRMICYTTLTAARTVSLPAAASYPVGTLLWVIDESGSCSSTNTITLSRAGSDTINDASSKVINSAYGFIALESNGSNAWTVAASAAGSGTVTSVATSYPLSGGPITGTGTAAYSGPTWCGRLAYVSATQIKFSPYNGDLIRIAGVDYQIPSGGVTAANTSAYVNGTAGQNLAASTLYYVYLFNNSGTLTVNFSTTGHATDATAGNVGTEIENGNNAYTLIGMVYTNASSQFGGAMLVASWFNRQLKSNSASGFSNYTTTSTTLTELIANAIQFLSWSDDSALIGIKCIPFNSVSGDYGQFFIQDQNSNQWAGGTCYAPNSIINPYYQMVPAAVAEGLTSLSLWALSQTGSNTFTIENINIWGAART